MSGKIGFFSVDLTKLKLTEAEHASIQAAIHTAVLGQMAQIDKAKIGRIKPEIYGMINPDVIAKVQKFNKQKLG